MEHVIGIIREYRTRNFRVVIDAIEEDCPDFSWDESGETQEAIESGKYLVFVARARVFFKGHEVAADYLGNCVYESLEDFKSPGYYSDMIHEVCSATRKYLRDIQSVKFRQEKN